MTRATLHIKKAQLFRFHAGYEMPAIRKWISVFARATVVYIKSPLAIGRQLRESHTRNLKLMLQPPFLI